MTLSWVRTVSLVTDYDVGGVLLGRLSNGQTYVRTHFRWGFYGDTATTVDMEAIAANLQVFGIVTVFGNGSETAPNPRTSPGDASPPTQRWLYYEARAPIPRAIDNGAGVVMWTDNGSTEATDIKAQVLATGVPGGDALDLWACWAAAGVWDNTGSAHVWVQASVLYKH
jgi:hypothetical protein